MSSFSPRSACCIEIIHPDKWKQIECNPEGKAVASLELSKILAKSFQASCFNSHWLFWSVAHHKNTHHLAFPHVEHISRRKILQNQGFLPVALATPVPGNPTTVHKESVQFTWRTWHLQFFKMNSETTWEIHTYYTFPAKNQACLPKASPWDFLLIFFGGSVKRTEEIKASTSLQPQISCGFVTATFGSPHLCEKSWSVQNYTFPFICIIISYHLSNQNFDNE